MKILDKNNCLYKGVLKKPLGKESLDWTPKEQLLFRASKYGDNTDRPIKKYDKSWTYFASDIANHHDKVLIGFCENRFAPFLDRQISKKMPKRGQKWRPKMDMAQMGPRPNGPGPKMPPGPK